MSSFEQTMSSYRNAYNLISILEHKIICAVEYILKRTSFYKKNVFIAGIPCGTSLQPQKGEIDESTWGEDFLPGAVFKYVIRKSLSKKKYNDSPFSILKVADNSMRRIFSVYSEEGQSFIVLLFYNGKQENKFNIWKDSGFNEFLSGSIAEKGPLIRNKDDSQEISIAKKYELRMLTSEDNANAILDDFNKILINNGIDSILK